MSFSPVLFGDLTELAVGLLPDAPVALEVPIVFLHPSIMIDLHLFSMRCRILTTVFATTHYAAGLNTTSILTELIEGPLLLTLRALLHVSTP